ncbi:hypothetical protein Y1Q_0009583 [Alligator mississippiensis]|uniref:Uncharacterized protein n=1 Tax=Alligator mississippiensis TaxID=8496 RepID=A0A151NUY1_ALLMI|nr:hypothetical protein Y1Q_0009583 [Alligator mississippiensis]
MDPKGYTRTGQAESENPGPGSSGGVLQWDGSTFYEILSQNTFLIDYYLNLGQTANCILRVQNPDPSP